ncbi:MAG TPA: peptidase T [Candidatus Faecaligallichristensenella faecipullorum]|nr:peptidase T [Candidatus Faecaligallichristensenella faecipullorum]
MDVTERFLKYVSFDTTSSEESNTCPTTPGQRLLGEELVKEMLEMGIKDARIDEYGYVYGSIPASAGCENEPCVGLIAHMDTSPAMPGGNIKPRIIKNYDGGDIVLNEALNIVTRAADFEGLAELKGKDLIVTDGTTLLGGDDKAGVAAIMCAAETLMSHPELKHGRVAIGFTPDEEVGKGADHFDIKGFGAEYAYTLDGGMPGEVDYENFNAASAEVKVNGVSIHPGSAKGRLKHAALIAMEFNAMLPAAEIPGCTEGYEGFHHLECINGDASLTQMSYILRDFDMNKLKAKKAQFEGAADFLNLKYGAGTVEVKIEDSYFNMKEMIADKMYIIERAYEAMRKEGDQPISRAIRGGTDGSKLSYMGLPCPNLPTGAAYGHGRHELACIQAMESMVRVAVNLLTVE